MRRDDGQSGMAVPLLVSLLLHVGVGAAIVASPLGSAASAMRFDLEEEEKKEDERERLELGSATSTATTMTWIGYDEYEKHIAQPAEVDQAAFDPGSERGTPDSFAENPEAGQMATSRPEVLAQSETIEPREAESRLDERAPELTREDSEPVETAHEDESELPEPPESPQVVESDDAAADFVLAPEESEALELAGPSKPEELEKLEEAPQDPSKAGESVPAASVPLGAPARRGNQADRESVATSVIRAANQDLGKPLSAQGLEIQTVRPVFTYYTRLTAAPRNPLVVVKFDRHGRVQDVEIVRSTGNGDVDRNIRDALYRWRARGEALGKLEDRDPPQTVDLRIEIIL